MSKHRPSEPGRPRTGASSRQGRTAGYWRRRIFRNTYTRNGRRFAVRGWRVKIQYAGRRVTLALRSSNPAEAAAEARLLHQRILSQGWSAMGSSNFDPQPEPLPRDVTVAFRWADNPVVWTYATIRTAASPRGRPAGSAAPASVAIVESDRRLRQALSAAVNGQKGFAVTTGFATAQEVQREISRQAVHLVLINQNLLDPAGALLGELLRRAPRTAPLVYSVYADSGVLFRSTPSGAVGYLLKRTPPHQILDPIAGGWDAAGFSRERMEASVHRYFRGLLGSWVNGDTVQALAKLTWREREILALLSQGNLDKHIADTLRISVWTVHGHLKNIYEKLGVHSRTEAVVKYLQQ